MNPRVLFFADPHPIRNSFIEFLSPAKSMCEIGSHIKKFDIEWRLFSNDHILDALINDCHPDNLLRPDTLDSDTISSFFSEWNHEKIEERTALINGHGSTYIFYKELLAKIYNQFEFTHVVLWSENGAVANFASERGIGIIHLELGPTRQPFQETIYLDPFGTNGNNFLKGINIPCVHQTKRSVDTWTSFALQDLRNKHVNSLKCLPLTEEFRNLYDEKYIVIALQLADDINTILNSPFGTPKEFLEHIIPPLLNMGYHVLIKGHPSALSRPYNLVQETAALSYSSTFEGNVTVIDRNLPVADFIPIIVHAQYVISINSSVSFESWLLGTPGLVFGDSSYDVNGQLKESSEIFLNTGDFNYRNFTDNYNFLLKNYFIPNHPPFIGKILSRMIHNYDFKGSKLDYYNWILENIDTLNIDIEIENSKTSWIKLREELLCNADISDRYFHYIIERSDLNDDHLIFKGWAGRNDIYSTHPIEAALVYDNKIISVMPLSERPDVSATHSMIHRNCGFSFVVKREEIPDLHLLRFVLIGEDQANIIPFFNGPSKDTTSLRLLRRIFNRIKAGRIFTLLPHRPSQP